MKNLLLLLAIFMVVVIVAIYALGFMGIIWMLVKIAVVILLWEGFKYVRTRQ